MSQILSHTDSLPTGGSEGVLRRTVRRWPISSFYLLTLVVSWPFGLLPPGPSIAGIAAAALIDGWSEVRELLRRVMIWRVHIKWYVVALLGPVALFGVAVWVNLLMGAEMVPGGRLLDLSEFGSLFALQVVGVFAGAWEELGWRGFALPRLLKRNSPLSGSLILGGLWAVWHIPLFINASIPWVDGLFIVPASILFTSVFVRTSQSVLIAFLMHAAVNAAAGVAVPLFEGADRIQMYWSVSAVTAVLAMVVVGLQAKWWMTRPSPKVVAAVRAADVNIHPSG